MCKQDVPKTAQFFILFCYSIISPSFGPYQLAFPKLKFSLHLTIQSLTLPNPHL